MFQVSTNQTQYDVQFRYGEKNFPWKYDETDKKEKWKVKLCRYTEIIITEMSENLVNDEENPLYDDKVLIVHQEHCSPQDNFCYDRGRREALKKSLEKLFPNIEEKPIRRDFWYSYFASQICSKLSLKPLEWRKVFV